MAVVVLCKLALRVVVKQLCHWHRASVKFLQFIYRYTSDNVKWTNGYRTLATKTP